MLESCDVGCPIHSLAFGFWNTTIMPLFKRDNSKPLIPPVEDRVSPRPGFRSNASTYVPSRDGDLYSTQSNTTLAPNDSYDADRYALMGDYVPRAANNEPPPEEGGDDDVEGIKQQTRFIKQESVQSSRNALRLAREAEETARNTLVRLGEQSGIVPVISLFDPILIQFKHRETSRHGASP